MDIGIENILVRVTGQVLIENTDLKLANKEKYGLISPNGRGKSTLLKHIATGLIKIPENMSCLYVEQEVIGEEISVFDTVINANIKRTELIKKNNELEIMMENEEDETKYQELVDEYTIVNDEMNAINIEAE
ncbi:MAG: hypothetical protein CMF62_03980 [Magnetococcales bacterium]|nr:hypothetical protein [Magnetococcales bacterium]